MERGRGGPFGQVRAGEGAAVGWAFTYFFCLIGSFYVLRPIREEMGIRGGVDQLQWSFTATFLVMLVAVPVYSALVARVPRARAVPIVYAFFAACLVAFHVAFRIDPHQPVVARTFFTWLSVFNLFVVTVFWSLMADLFTSEQGRRLFGLVAGGGSAGALAGSALTGSFVHAVGVANILLFSVALLAGAAFCATRLAAWARASGRGVAPGARDADPLGGSAWSGFAAVVRSPYLLGAAALMLLFTLGSTFLYFQQARIVAQAFPDPATRPALFAWMDFAVSLGSLGFQTLATGPIAATFGLLPALTVVPLVTTAGFLVLAAVPGLWSLVAFQGLRRISEFAFQRPARDVLYTVVSRDEKYKAKSFIDTVVYRGGDTLGGWAFEGLKALGLSASALALSAVPFAVGSIFVGVWLAREHARRERAAPGAVPVGAPAGAAEVPR
ncbi:MAG: MFS transporter [Anaeromyxobacter sp.]